MMRFRPLLAAVAAAGMLAAGCDYWRNLVDERTVATAHLKLIVRDVFTLEGVVATCTDSSRGLVMSTALGSGYADTLNAGTGMYTILCKGWGYYDKAISFPLTPAGDTVVFDVPRRGEVEWYKDHPTRAVRIRERFDTLRFPGAFDFNAYPEDTTKLLRFRYEWTFSKAKGLDQTTDSEPSKYPVFHRDPDSANASPGTDTLTLRVWSLMNDPEIPYYIGMDKRPFVWKRNQLPRLVMDKLDTGRRYPVGCPSIYQKLQIQFRGEDPDGNGTCRSVRFFTEGTTSAFGPVDTTLPCFQQRIDFELGNTLDSLRNDSVFLRPSTMNITVTDDNGGRFDTSIVIVTRTNILPIVTSSIEGTPTSAFTGDSVKVNFVVSDSDGIPQTAIIKWGDVDGETRLDFSRKGTNSVVGSAFRVYRTPGPRSINVSVIDICGNTANSFTGEILIQDNRDPQVKFKYLRDEGTAQNHLYFFQITATDEDISEGLGDRITGVYVNWGEGAQPLDPPASGAIYEWRPHFTQPPDSLGRYRISINVQDAHGGSVTLDTLFQAP